MLIKLTRKIDISGSLGSVKRHLPFVYNFTPSRLANGVRSTYSYMSRSRVNKGYPLFLKVETSALCNLSCPGCMHGMQNEYFKKYMMISYETFRKIIDEIGPYLFKVIMYHRGEAFFNKNIYDMLEYLKRYNIHSSISSNFNFRFKTEDFKNIVHSHLTHLILSVDGITQDVYTKYRRGGNLELVKHNIRELANMKKAYKSNKPVMELQFIIFKHNVHQLKKLDSFAKELGIDRISITKDVTLDGGFYAGCNCKEKITEEYIQKEIAKRTNFRPLCEWPWYAAVVKWNGEIVPCCHYDWGNETLGFGNIVHDYFWNIWNGQRYIKLRQFLSRPKRSSRIDPFCSGCLKLIGKRPVI